MKNHETHLPPPVPASDASQREPIQPRRGWPYAAIAAAGVVGIVGGIAAGVAIGGATTETATPTACITAIDLADEALAVTSDAMGTIADGFLALSDGNVLLADIIMSDLDSDTEKITEMQDAYHEAKDECRASHD